MKKIILCVSFFCIFVGLSPANAEIITGMAQSIDGDTIIIDGIKLRLDGVDVIEKKQKCKLKGNNKIYPASEAKAWLESFIISKDISCGYVKEGKYRRPLATCFFEGKNINELLVRKGYGDINPRYNQRYLKILEEVKKKKIGIWAVECEKPWDWRKEQRTKAKKKN